MLKNLLKYEFRATGRTYGGLYLVWLLVALAMGISMRDEVWDNGSSQIWAYLMFAYFAIGVAIGVVCIVTIIQRFTKICWGGRAISCTPFRSIQSSWLRPKSFPAWSG